MVEDTCFICLNKFNNNIHHFQESELESTTCNCYKLKSVCIPCFNEYLNNKTENKNKCAVCRSKILDTNMLLIEASKDGNIEKVRMLLEKGYGVNHYDDNFKTALIYASENGHTDTVSLLLEKGAYVNHSDIYYFTALMEASHGGHTDIVSILLEWGAKVNAISRNELLDMGSGRTALMFASGSGSTDIVKMLLDKGAVVNQEDHDYNTALISAAREGYINTVSLLLEKGADVNAWNNKGVTALMYASEYGYTDIVSLLLANGADVNAEDNKGKTALIRAINYGWWSEDDDDDYDLPSLTKAEIEGQIDNTVSLLLEKGADVNAEDNNGNTALHYASKHGYTEIEKLINHYRRTELMKQRLKTALIIKKGLTQKGDKHLMPYALRETIHHIASFF